MSGTVPNQLVGKLAATVQSILAEITGNETSYAHIWYEESLNFGDSAIWFGQKNSLRELGVEPVYECSDRNYNGLAMRGCIGEKGAIFLRGGGNFGDLYGYHEMRLDVLEAFRDTPVIQLPQTAKFKTYESLARTRKIISRHNDITLLARDDMTLELFKENFPGDNVRVELCPDMSFSSGPLARTTAPEIDIVGLLRIDGESTLCSDKGRVYNRKLEQDLLLTDVDKRRYRVYQQDNREVFIEHVALLDRKKEIEVTDWYLCNLESFENSLYHELDYLTKARIGVMMALGILSRGRVVVTDRLHGYILCLQAGIPHVLIDNSYGKLSSFHATWGKDSRITWFADSAPEAFDLARQLVAQCE